MDTLYRHLHKWMSEPFVWGESDCMMVVADYLIDMGYEDPAAKWRGTYDSAMSCQRVSKFLTDAPDVMGDAVTAVGMIETGEPVRGDVGVVRFVDHDGHKMMGAVCLGKNWAVKGEHRVVVGPAQVVRAWRCEK